MSGTHWVDNLARHALSRPQRTAIRFEGRSITWSELNERVRRLSGALTSLGLGKGDRVAVLMLNRPEFVETVLAANRIGAIAVPVNFRLVAAEVQYVLRDSGATAVVTDETLALVVVDALGDEAVNIPLLVVGLSPDAVPGPEMISYEGALLSATIPPDVIIDERDVALIMYTSGTTGKPKGAMLTHLNLLMQAFTAIRTARLLDDSTVALCNVPLFHIAGIGGMPPSFLLGTTVVIMPTAPFSAERTLEVVDSEGVTGLFLVPAQWKVLCDHPEVTKRTTSLRTISWGAAPATVDLLETMSKRFPHAQIVSVFGQTEMSPVTTALSPEDAIRKIGSVGKPVPTVSVRVVDDEMRDVEAGQVGEIVYRGPTLMAGYWNKPGASAAACEGGWFHSGDLVKVDDEGFIFVVDRKKDMIISGGENVYCAEVENALAGHPSVADVAVIGAPHAKWGETPVAVIVPKDPAAPPSFEEIAAWTTPRLASYKKPTSLVIVDELPRNASGKVLKHELRALFRLGRVASK